MFLIWLYDYNLFVVCCDNFCSEDLKWRASSSENEPLDNTQ